MKNKATNMKSPAPNQSKGLLPKSSNVKKLSQKQPAPAKKSKSKLKVDPSKSIKEKLTGKIFSPIVEKAKIKLKQNATALQKKKKSEPGTLPKSTTTKKSKPAPDNENNTLPVVKNKKKQTESTPKDEVKGKRSLAPKVNVGKEKIKPPKLDKPTSLKADQVQPNVSGKKRKLKPENSELPVQKKKVKEEVKVEEEPIPTLVEIKEEKQSLARKPRQAKMKEEKQSLAGKPRPAKMKRKLSITSVKDLKPISNIKSLVKKPRKFSKGKNKSLEYPERGVCYFSHIPHGFYEKQLEQYCSQFGKVTGVYHPVSSRGNSRGYAFVEFQHKEVAEVVAETMNNYLMFNRLLKCEYIPPESQKPWVFKQDRNNQKAASLRRMENLKSQMRHLTNAEVKKWKKRRVARMNAIHKKLASLGVDYEFQVNDTNITETKKEENIEK